mgnify:CR=1 FL=1
MTTSTPPDLTITPRDLRLDRNASSARWWHGGDPVATAYFNALTRLGPRRTLLMTALVPPVTTILAWPVPYPQSSGSSWSTASC